MLLLIIITLSLLLICFLIFVMNIKFEISISIHSPGNKISLKITTLYGVIRIKREFELSEIIAQENEDNQDYQEEDSAVPYDTIFAALKVVYKDIILLIKKVKIYILEWSSQVGLGDAASSAIAAGAVWSIKGTIIAFLKSQLNFKHPPEIKVFPNFQGFTAQTHIKCMLKLKAGNAILTGYKILKKWKSYRKEADFGHHDQNQTIDRRILNG